VGYYPDRAEKFYMNHNYARINPLKALIEDLKIFLKGLICFFLFIFLQVSNL